MTYNYASPDKTETESEMLVTLYEDLTLAVHDLKAKNSSVVSGGSINPASLADLISRLDKSKSTLRKMIARFVYEKLED